MEKTLMRISSARWQMVVRLVVPAIVAGEVFGAGERERERERETHVKREEGIDE